MTAYKITAEALDECIAILRGIELCSDLTMADGDYARTMAASVASTLRASLTPYQDAPLTAGWQDISTAPRDGTRILIHGFDGITSGHWSNDWERWLGCANDGVYPYVQNPTYWMHLPSAPPVPAAPTPEEVK